MVSLEIDEGITDSPDGSLRDAATATDFDPSDSSVPRYVKYFFLKKKDKRKISGKFKNTKIVHDSFARFSGMNIVFEVADLSHGLVFSKSGLLRLSFT